MTAGDGPTPFSQKRPKKTVKNQHKSTPYIPWPNGRANANTQHSDGHPKPIIHLPKRHRPPLEGERHVRATNGNAHSSSEHPMPQKLVANPNKARGSNGDEPVDTSNKSEMLVIASIELEGPASGGVPRVRFGGESQRADDANGPRDQVDVSKGQADELEGRTDESRARADASNTPNEAKTVIVSHRTGAGTYLSTGDAKRAVDGTNNLSSRTEMSEGQVDVSRARTDAPNASNGAGMAGISHRDNAETHLDARDAKRAVDKTDGIGSHMPKRSYRRDKA